MEQTVGLYEFYLKKNRSYKLSERLTSDYSVYNFSKKRKWNILSEEKCWMLVFDAKCNVIGIVDIAIGTSNRVTMNFKDILKKVLMLNGHAFILVHNHPSGEVAPSEADIEFSKKLKKASNLLDIQLLDSIIIGEKKYFSLEVNNLLKV